MDILYILGEGYSKCNNNELRYSLRSIEKYGENIDRVFVAGYCPEWLSDEVIKVPIEESHTTDQWEKNYNIARKIFYVAENTNIGDEFLVSMDDHFYNKRTNFNNYPYYVNTDINKGFLPKKHQTLHKEYFKILYENSELLKKKDLPNFYFTIHKNMYVSKKDIPFCKELLQEAEKNHIGYELFVVMNNYRFKNGEIIPTFSKDHKLRGGIDWYKTTESECFSTYDFETDSSLDILLRSLYPNKSKYEK